MLSALLAGEATVEPSRTPALLLTQAKAQEPTKNLQALLGEPQQPPAFRALHNHDQDKKKYIITNVYKHCIRCFANIERGT